MKTEPMSQQVEALRRLDGKWFYALFMEQGTGKTWAYLADAQRYHERGKIDGLFVLAPNGVHTNWVRREIPTHMEDDRVVAAAWAPNATGARKKLLDAILKPFPSRLRVLTMNYEALATSRTARAHARAFLESGRMLFDLDESQKIKNPRAAITKAIMLPPARGAKSLRNLAIARRIGTGTPMDKPADIFSQFEFLEHGLLGTSNFRAFMAEYAVLADWKDPKIDADWAFKRQVEKNPRMAHAIIIARDEVTGQPMYRNLDKLNALVAKHSYRVLKKDCMDLPPKVYESVYFELTPGQRAAYELMENELRILVDDKGADVKVVRVHALSKLVKLQQITSGYVVVPGRDELLYVEEKNPRVQAVVDYVDENVSGSVIIWAKFREEVRALSAALTKAGRRVVEYHGDVKDKDREEAIDALQSGRVDCFVGVQKAGGTGLTLTKATKTIYCSNEHSAILRAQSEDRNHRKGTAEVVAAEGGESVVYIDAVATDTIDEGITRGHQFKMDVAEAILGARGIDLRGLL